MTPADSSERGPSRARLALGRAATVMFQRMGYEVVPKLPPGASAEETRRAKLLETMGVNVVLDVGANAGQFAVELRRAGYAGRIVSFEPLDAAFADLVGAAGEDPAWECRQVALGASDGTSTINVAGNQGASSSMLDMKERHLQSAPESAYVATEEVPLARLDTVWPELVGDGERAYLKLDVQGFEMEVLRGAEAALSRVAGVQAELSLVPLYEGAPSFRDLIDYFTDRGFRLAGLEAGHDDRKTGEMLQADGIFIRD